MSFLEKIGLKSASPSGGSGRFTTSSLPNTATISGALPDPSGFEGQVLLPEEINTSDIPVEATVLDEEVLHYAETVEEPLSELVDVDSWTAKIEAMTWSDWAKAAGAALALGVGVAAVSSYLRG